MNDRLCNWFCSCDTKSTRTNILFTDRDTAVTTNSVQIRNYAVMSFLADRILHAAVRSAVGLRSAITAIAELLVFLAVNCLWSQ